MTVGYRHLIFLLFPLLLSAQIREDEVLHFGAGMVAGGAGAIIASEISHGNRFWTFTGAVGASLLAGAAKEAIDAGKANNSWDNGDLAATVLGGVTIGLTIDLFTAGARKRRNRVLNLSGWQENSAMYSIRKSASTGQVSVLLTSPLPAIP